MHITESTYVKPYVFNVKLNKGNQLNFNKSSYDCQVRLAENGEVLLLLEDSIHELNFKNNRIKQRITYLLSSRNTQLSSIIKNGLDNELTIQLYEFSQIQIYLNNPEIGLDGLSVEEVKKHIRISNVDTLHSLLNEEFVLNHGYKNKCYILINPLMKDELGFSIYGKKLIADIKLNNKKYYLDKIRKSHNNRNLTSLSLVECNIQFKEINKVKYEPANYSVIENIHKNSKGYLELWNDYNNKELEYVYEKQKRYGYIKYNSVEKLEYHSKLLSFGIVNSEDISALQRLYSAQEMLEISSDIPTNYKVGVNDNSYGTSSVLGKIFEVGKTVIIETEEELKQIPQSGYIYLSLRGDKKRIQRRKEASEIISSNRAIIPNLSQLIEGVEYQPSVIRKYKSSSQSIGKAIKEIFGNEEPNDSQKKAIKAALETPDYAVILGPPGTGKTKVIRAIAKAIFNESQLETNSNVSKGNILFSSESHDAVDNMIKGTKVMGLPALKIDRGNDKNESIIRDFTQELITNISLHPYYDSESFLEKYVYEIIHLVCTLNTLIKTPILLIKDLEDLSKKISATISTQSMLQLNNTISQLNNILLVKTNLSREEKWILNILSKLNEENKLNEDERNKLVNKIKLRLESVDKKLYMEVKDNSDDEAVLNKVECFLFSKSKLLNIPEIRSNITNVLLQIKKELEKRIIESKDSIGTILKDFCDQLENNPIEIEKAILDYTQVIGATAQGSSRYNVAEHKDNNDIYDAVIIDEAARVLPTDLMIPLAKAKRFILVGDDNQLPHMYDSEILDDILLTKEEERIYKESLFYRLKELAKKRSGVDGINRIVQLDTQYRMHPEIGTLVGDIFYRPSGLELKNGIPPHLAEHTIKQFIGKQFVWFNVPNNRGAEISRRSKKRPCEAEVISKKLCEYLIDNQDLSFGVITFYSDQKSEIISTLKKDGILEMVDEVRLINKYNINHLSNRLKIGTVDAFQGQEFDVVILSLVRSNSISFNSDNEMSLRNKYGFLCVKNRQNVAFSRAKRLLITVGDYEMFSREEIKESLTGFYELAKKCGGPNGAIIKL